MTEVACKIISYNWFLSFLLKLFEEVVVDYHHSADTFTSQITRILNRQDLSQWELPPLLSGFCDIDKVFIGTHFCRFIGFVAFPPEGEREGKRFAKTKLCFDLNDLD